MLPGTMATTLDSFRAELLKAPAILEAYLARFLEANAPNYAFGELFEPLYLDLTEFVGRRGKRIRPLLFLASYRVFGGDRPLDDDSLMRAALSLELLHAFILIHDDVIDQSERRRGLPTFHKLVEERLRRFEGAARIGENVAIVMGDVLFAMAFETLHASDFPPPLRDAALARSLRYVAATGAGEIYDVLLAPRDIARVKEADIEQMYHLKTTRYTFEAPLILGGLLAGASERILQDLSGLITPIGLAFQIQNDLLEYQKFKGTERLGQRDILDGKKTLLLRVAFDRLDDLDRSFLQLCLSTRASSEAALTKIEQLIDKSEAVLELNRRMDALFQQSEAALLASSLNEIQREGLRDVIIFIRQQVQYTGTQ